MLKPFNCGWNVQSEATTALTDGFNTSVTFIVLERENKLLSFSFQTVSSLKLEHFTLQVCQITLNQNYVRCWVFWRPSTCPQKQTVSAIPSIHHLYLLLPVRVSGAHIHQNTRTRLHTLTGTFQQLTLLFSIPFLLYEMWCWAKEQYLYLLLFIQPTYSNWLLLAGKEN